MSVSDTGVSRRNYSSEYLTVEMYKAYGNSQVINHLLPKGSIPERIPLVFWSKIFFSMYFRHMFHIFLARWCTHVMVKMHRNMFSVPWKKICRMTVYESNLDNMRWILISITALHAVACLLYIVQSQIVEKHKTMNVWITCSPNCANWCKWKSYIQDGGR